MSNGGLTRTHCSICPVIVYYPPAKYLYGPTEDFIDKHMVFCGTCTVECDSCRLPMYPSYYADGLLLGFTQKLKQQHPVYIPMNREMMKKCVECERAEP